MFSNGNDPNGTTHFYNLHITNTSLFKGAATFDSTVTTGTNTVNGYLTVNNTVSILADSVSDTGTALQISKGGIDLTRGAINNNYCCQMMKLSGQAISSGVYTKITGLNVTGTIAFDNRLTGMADVANSQILIQKTGKYFIRAQCYGELAANSGHTLILGINNVFYDTTFAQDPQALASWCSQITHIRNLTAGDTVQIYAAVNSGGNLGGSAPYQGFYLYVGLID